MFILSGQEGRGSIKAISTSKIRNTTAIRKKCMEKGSRALLRGEKPHSKGEYFCGVGDIFLHKVVFNLIRAREMIIEILEVIIITSPARTF